MKNVNQKINILSKKLETNTLNNTTPNREPNKNELYEDIRAKLNETPQNNDIFDEPRKNVDGVRVNIVTVDHLKFLKLVFYLKSSY